MKSKNKAPEVQAPEVQAPEVQAPEVQAPEVQAPVQVEVKNLTDSNIQSLLNTIEPEKKERRGRKKKEEIESEPASLGLPIPEIVSKIILKTYIKLLIKIKVFKDGVSEPEAEEITAFNEAFTKVLNRYLPDLITKQPELFSLMIVLSTITLNRLDFEKKEASKISV